MIKDVILINICVYHAAIMLVVQNMTQQTIDIFVYEIIWNHQKGFFITSKTDVYHIDDIWKLDILDLQNYGPENNRGCRYVLVVIDNFSKVDLTVLLSNRKHQ